MRILHVVRHAQGTHNVDQKYRDPPDHDTRLTGFGAQQYEALSRTPHVEAQRSASLVITSPLTRCVRPPCCRSRTSHEGGGVLHRSQCIARLPTSPATVEAPVGDRGGLSAGGFLRRRRRRGRGRAVGEVREPVRAHERARRSQGELRPALGGGPRQSVLRVAATEARTGGDRELAQRVPAVRVQLGPGRRGAGGARSGAGRIGVGGIRRRNAQWWTTAARQLECDLRRDGKTARCEPSSWRSEPRRSR